MGVEFVIPTQWRAAVLYFLSPLWYFQGLIHLSRLHWCGAPVKWTLTLTCYFVSGFLDSVSCAYWSSTFPATSDLGLSLALILTTMTGRPTFLGFLNPYNSSTCLCEFHSKDLMDSTFCSVETLYPALLLLNWRLTKQRILSCSL